MFRSTTPAPDFARTLASVAGAFLCAAIALTAALPIVPIA